MSKTALCYKAVIPIAYISKLYSVCKIVCVRENLLIISRVAQIQVQAI